MTDEKWGELLAFAYRIKALTEEEDVIVELINDNNPNPYASQIINLVTIDNNEGSQTISFEYDNGIDLPIEYLTIYKECNPDYDNVYDDNTWDGNINDLRKDFKIYKLTEEFEDFL